MMRNKSKMPLIVECVLVPVVYLSYWYAFSIEILGGLLALTSVVWIITALASPMKNNYEDKSLDVAEVPTIKCPNCNTINPGLSDTRPLRIPCGGCGKTLKIVG